MISVQTNEKWWKAFFFWQKFLIIWKYVLTLSWGFFLCKFNLRNSVHPFISIRYIIDNYWFIMFFIVKDIIYKLAPNLLLFKRQFQLPTVCCSPSPSGCIGPISPILFSAFYMGWVFFFKFLPAKANANKYDRRSLDISDRHFLTFHFQ